MGLYNKYFACPECKITYTVKPSEQQDPRYNFCKVCGAQMARTRRPKDDSPNHTQILHYLIMGYVEKNQEIQREVQESLKKIMPQSALQELLRLLMNFQIQANAALLEQMMALDDTMTKIRQYPYIRDNLFRSLKAEVPLREFIMNQWRNLDL